MSVAVCSIYGQCVGKCWERSVGQLSVGEVLGHKELGLVVFTAGWPGIAGNRAEIGQNLGK